jgi:S-adenosylmethionine uptake transporter
VHALWMIAGSFFFATMAVCVKYASAWFSSSDLVFWRGIVGIVFMWVLARRQGVSMRTQYPFMHAWRSLVGVVSLGTWFYAIAVLPLATAVTLSYMSSVWIAAWFLLRGREVRGSLLLAVAAGFAGVVLILRPSIAEDQWLGAVVGLVAGLTAAFAYMQVMALGKIGEPDSRTVFYFAVGSAVYGAAGMLLGDTRPLDWAHAWWVLPVGLLAALGQLCITAAYGRGGTLVVACLQYSGIVFGAIYSIALFSEHLPAMGWAGMVLVIASGVTATVLRSR